MPSNARKSFNQNAEDIDNLIDVYEGLVELWDIGKEPIPEGYEVLFRSAVVLMVSNWEAYVEDICSEALTHLVKHAKSSEKLPKGIKRQVADELKSEKSDIGVWILADDGWRGYLSKRLDALKEARDRSFNTPKAQHTADFIQRVLGIENVTTAWVFDGHTPESATRKLDALVEVRGTIAHRGRLSARLDDKYVKEHVAFLRHLVSKTGGKIHTHVKRVTGVPLWE